MCGHCIQCFEKITCINAMFVFVNNVSFLTGFFMGLLNVSHVDGFLYMGE